MSTLHRFSSANSILCYILIIYLLIYLSITFWKSILFRHSSVVVGWQSFLPCSPFSILLLRRAHGRRLLILSGHTHKLSVIYVSNDLICGKQSNRVLCLYVTFDSTGFAAFSKSCQTLLYNDTLQRYWLSCCLTISLI